MKKSLSRMNTNELRDLAVELGADRKKLYGTSKQSLILRIDTQCMTVATLEDLSDEEMKEVRDFIDRRKRW